MSNFVALRRDDVGTYRLEGETHEKLLAGAERMQVLIRPPEAASQEMAVHDVALLSAWSVTVPASALATPLDVVGILTYSDQPPFVWSQRLNTVEPYVDPLTDKDLGDVIADQ